MKTTITQKVVWFVLITFIVTSCDVYVVDPQYRSRNRIVGHYDVQEYSNTYDGYHNYHMHVDRGYEVNEIILHNFYDVGVDIVAYVNYDQITIPFQTIAGYDIQGSGSIYSGKLYLDYSVRDKYEGITDFCEADAWLN